MSDAPQSSEELEDLLSEPSTAATTAIQQLDGDIIVLGVGGKMGPTLARMAKRADPDCRVIGVSRFTNEDARRKLESCGVETIACDLLDADQLNKLPSADNVVHMPVLKFGATDDPSKSWATNCLLAGQVAQKYSNSKIIAFSTGNVYTMVAPETGGSVEDDELKPEGEYAMSCFGRERILEHISRNNETRMSIIRLNYACDLRYGVMVDIARSVMAGELIDVSMGYFNTIWQGDANAMTLAAFADATSPPFVINVTGSATLNVRQVSERFAQLFNKNVQLVGDETSQAFLSNASSAHDKYGEPRVNEDRLIEWVADWLLRGGETLNRPTHFQVRDGKF